MTEKLIFIADSKKRKKFSWNKKCLLCLLPEFSGIFIFYLMPFGRAVFYSFIDNQFRKNFVGFVNYLKTWRNDYFCLAMKNSLLLIFIAVPLLLLLALTISLVISFCLPGWKWLKISFFLPVLLPSAAAAVIWQELFPDTSTVIPLYLLFIWKNTGICVLLLTARFSAVESEILEAAKMDGAGKIKIYTGIILPSALPVIIFDTLLSIVNSFRIFRESYLYYGGNYPPEHSYTLQYYMNNNFLNLNYQALSTSGISVTGLVMVLVVLGLYLQKKTD